ncbi:MAG: hypothetical protein ACI4V3_10205 [Faecousia sp.]
MNAKVKRLPSSFFRENPLMEMSAAVVAHYMITTRLTKEEEQIDSNLAEHAIDEIRREKILQERQYIEQTDDPAVLVELMRKGHDILNRLLLCTKILSLHEQTMPLLLKRYRTCVLDSFIDAATEVLATGEKKYAQMLREMYADIRCPFAQACACLVFGMQGMEQEIPFLLSEYTRFQREYPEETYHQHPLLALYILHGKF